MPQFGRLRNFSMVQVYDNNMRAYERCPKWASLLTYIAYLATVTKLLVCRCCHEISAQQIWEVDTPLSHLVVVPLVPQSSICFVWRYWLEVTVQLATNTSFFSNPMPCCSLSSQLPVLTTINTRDLIFPDLRFMTLSQQGWVAVSEHYWTAPNCIKGNP